MARDWFADAFGAAVDDIRKRLVEEPWFGRDVTPPHEPAEKKSHDLGWVKDDPALQEHQREHDLDHGR